jgi:hypothetical protein
LCLTETVNLASALQVAQWYNLPKVRPHNCLLGSFTPV